MTTKAETRLRDELIIWMTTVNTKGVPQTSPVWFLYEGDGFLVYSLRSARITNIKANPAVSLNLDGNGEGGDIVIIEGVARIDLDQPPAHEVPAYTKKYAGKFKEYGWDPEQFSSDYPVPILITRTRMRA